MFINIKNRLDDPVVLQLLAASSYENSMERAVQKAEEFRSRHNWSLSGWIENGDIVGSCGYKVYHTDRVEIISIAVTENWRKRNIGSKMIAALHEEFLLPIHAETDDDAVGFYRKVGFETTECDKNGYCRYACVLAAPDFAKTIEGLDASKVIVSYMQKITETQMWEFYVRNDICEAGYGKDVAVKALRYNNSHIVAAFFEDKLVGIIRAMFDGLGMYIVECGLELALQGDNLTHDNGSLIEKDTFGIFKQMGLLLLDETKKLGGTFFEFNSVVENLEEATFESFGMKHNTGHLPYYIDLRPYVQEG
jgi:N-acetylglutamate synthase-like GNAT family acetyltransferase